MPRRILSAAERAQRRKDQWVRILHGQRRPGVANGSPAEWARAARSRLGLPPPRATGTIADAAEILGAVWPCDLQTARRSYRLAILAAHPDRGGTDEAALRVIEAWETVREALNKPHAPPSSG